MKDFSVVIPSRNTSNLAHCLESIFLMEPDVPKARIVVIDDGVDLAFRAYVKVTWVDGIKPFIFSRNCNLGLRRGGDVILMNDDTKLLTPGGFTRMVSERPEQYGIVSAAIQQNVGNLNQRPAGTNGFRPIIGALAFICVLLPETTIRSVGLLDERYTAYGSEDNDYCFRARQMWMEQAVCDYCLVSHGVNGQSSTFRARSNNLEQLEAGRKIYHQKWGVRP